LACRAFIAGGWLRVGQPPAADRMEDRGNESSIRRAHNALRPAL
jgi:hypothetical protein